MSLSAAVAGVRHALTKALSDAGDQQVRFGVSGLDLEFHVEVLPGASEDDPAALRVIQSTADPATGHRIKLSLRPVHVNNNRLDELFIGEFTQDPS
ncbi:trypco2 family protein [Streptomyces tropicalis]|uniref:Trypsin-co-occurring domain-containing protein n=1 Tax=Streptomyces tropicalis TaxID=3034234 RepID=A0ABT6A630_9ACTN|nr:trypco2 family protein [Streptomyces tropicalis]MDF3300100.1 hypothetical protein [Streptomyces tropicalis]